MNAIWSALKSVGSAARAHRRSFHSIHHPRARARRDARPGRVAIGERYVFSSVYAGCPSSAFERARSSDPLAFEAGFRGLVPQLLLPSHSRRAIDLGESHTGLSSSRFQGEFDAATGSLQKLRMYAFSIPRHHFRARATPVEPRMRSPCCDRSDGRKPQAARLDFRERRRPLVSAPSATIAYSVRTCCTTISRAVWR